MPAPDSHASSPRCIRGTTSHPRRTNHGLGRAAQPPRGRWHGEPRGDRPRGLARAVRPLFQRALEVDPDSGALLGLAEVALLQRRTAAAAELLVRVDADNPMSIAAPFLRGYLAYSGGADNAAWRFFQTAVSRGELKKGHVKWTEEGDVKASPELRWRALARQSLFGAHWIRLRSYVAPPGPSREIMRFEYGQVSGVLAARVP